MSTKHIDSFGINSTKCRGVYLDIQMISNKKEFKLQCCRSRRVLQLWYEVYLHRTSYEKIMKFFIQHITTGSSYELAVMTHYYCRFLAKPPAVI
jgi:hypothetical protein